MSKKIKIFIIVAAVIVIGVVLASSMANDTPAPSPSDSALSTSALPAGVRPAVSGTGGTEGASDFSALLSSVNNINIDTSIFSNMAYRSLRDYPVTLGTDTVGRPNPFAPIGTDQGVVGQQISSSSAGPQVQTLQPGKITTKSAEFGAQVTVSDNVPVSVVFEYGVNDTFGSMTTPVTLTRSDTAIVTVNNLLPKTRYVVRAIVVKGSATANGNTIAFTTL